MEAKPLRRERGAAATAAENCRTDQEQACEGAWCNRHTSRSIAMTQLQERTEAQMQSYPVRAELLCRRQ
jgi:hypothetical protein